MRAVEASCPFCGEALSAPPAERPLPMTRLGRAAVFAFGAAIVGASGCAEHHGTDDAGTPDDSAVEEDSGPEPMPDSGVVPPYGAPPEDGGIAPLYGGAP